MTDTNPYVSDLLAELSASEFQLGPCDCASGEYAADDLLLAFVRAQDHVLKPEDIDVLLDQSDRSHALRHARWKLVRSEHSAFAIVWVPELGHYRMTDDPTELSAYLWYRTRVQVTEDLPMLAAAARARAGMDGRTTEGRRFSDFLDRRGFTLREYIRAGRDLLS